MRAVTFALILIAGCGSGSGESDGAATPSSPVVSVRVAPVVRADIERTVIATGRTEVARQQKIYAPIAGTVLSCRAIVGQRVGAGEALIVIRPKESQMQIDGAEALLATATTPEAKAEAERMLKLATAADNVAHIVAPVGGIVATRAVNAGEIVAEGAEMLSIVDPSSIVFTADVPLSAVMKIRAGTRCRVQLQAMPDTLLDAAISTVSPQSSAGSQSVPVRLEFRGVPSSTLAALKSDMNGTATIIIGMDRNALVVPSVALLRDDHENSYTVVTIDKDSLAKIIHVQVGPRQDSTAEVMGDELREGMDVIVEGNYALPDSTRVTATR